MPIGIKDIMETADMVTEQGSPLFVGWRGGRDAAAVAALRAAGAVIIGKTVTTEFAATHPRGTRNPWDLERTHARPDPDPRQVVHDGPRLRVTERSPTTLPPSAPRIRRRRAPCAGLHPRPSTTGAGR
jgi:hypothetical protein